MFICTSSETVKLGNRFFSNYGQILGIKEFELNDPKQNVASSAIPNKSGTKWELQKHGKIVVFKIKNENNRIRSENKEQKRKKKEN